MNRWRQDHGSASLELAVWAPVLLLITAVVLMAGRIAQAAQAVEVAAGEAARAGSMSATRGQAAARAAEAADAALSSAGLRCLGRDVSVDTSQWVRPAGTPARITATVECRVQLADLSIPGLPGSKAVSGSASSALDLYRARP